MNQSSMNQSSDFWTKASTSGLLLGLVTVAVMALQGAVTLGKSMSVVLSLVKLAGTAVLLYYFMKDFGKTQDKFSYADAFKYGFAVSFFSSIIAAGYFYFHMAFLFPDTTSGIVGAIAEQAATGQYGEMNLDFLVNHLPTVMALCMFIYYNFFGLFWSAILGAAAKHEEPMM